MEAENASRLTWDKFYFNTTEAKKEVETKRKNDNFENLAKCCTAKSQSLEQDSLVCWKKCYVIPETIWIPRIAIRITAPGLSLLKTAHSINLVAIQNGTLPITSSLTNCIVGPVLFLGGAHFNSININITYTRLSTALTGGDMHIKGLFEC